MEIPTKLKTEADVNVAVSVIGKATHDVHEHDEDTKVVMEMLNRRQLKRIGENKR